LGEGGVWSAAQRQRLRAQVQAGELGELEFAAVVYRTGPNANFVRFRPEDLAAFAASFAGQPFLRNHDVADIGARDGTILESQLVGGPPAPAELALGEIRQRIRLTTARGIRDFAEGIIDRFSIAWTFEGVICSICGQDWLRCEHRPGQRYPVTADCRPLAVDRSQRSAVNGQPSAVCELIFVRPAGKETSAVNAPAVPGTRVLDQLWQLKQGNQEVTKEGMAMDKQGIWLPNGSMIPVAQTTETVQNLDAGQETAALRAEVQTLQAQMVARQVDDLIAGAGLSVAGQEVVRLACAGAPAAQAGDTTFATRLIQAQRRVEAAAAAPRVVQGIRPVTAGQMTTPEERVQSALNWLFGVRDEPAPPPSLRSLRDLYQAITGDHNWYGVFNPEWAQLSSATTSTLAGMVVNAFNRVVRMHYDNLATYRWYERITDVVPHDGSTHDVAMVFMDGLANLPAVDEGAAYTEATVGDSKETFAFAKHGHYVGITLETIRRSDIQRLQAIPREMVKASIRTRSAAIAGMFTAAGGAGPTLADDSKALFHTDHGNLDVAALDATAWGAARQRIWSQTVPGTSAPLGLWPTFCLVPIELYDAALELFGYGSGDVGKPNSGGTAQAPNPYGDSRPGDPRPIPIVVPEWSDAANWAYIVDPRLHPVICMAYANAPQGGAHPLPEIFEVTSETSGLMFTNDTLPVKIRDWWGYGVASYVGVGKNNVAG
jgi:hypothetical protein